MSFGLPPLTSKSSKDSQQVEIKTDSSYDLPNPMVSGLSVTKQNIGNTHPLEVSERNYQKNQDRLNMSVLRSTQGLHAPLRMAMELKLAEKFGRLPFLPSSNVMRDVLLARDLDIGFEDIFNIPEFQERMGQPHAIVENQSSVKN